MYTVKCKYDGVDYTIHDPNSELLHIYSDELRTVKNDAGSFTFSMAKEHPYIDMVKGMQSDIRVYDGEEKIWRGRPIDDGEDLYGARTFTCEGELAFLYDSLQPRKEFHNVSPLAFLTELLSNHNNQVKNNGMIDRQFSVGIVEITGPNDSLYRYTNRETTYDCIKDKILDRLGGYLRVREEGSKRYLDIMKIVPTQSSQPIQLGDNLMDFAKDTDYTQIATACIPLGASLEESEIPALDAYLTVADVNGGSEVIQIDEAVAQYGFICKTVSFSDITVPANLLRAGTEWLTSNQYADVVLSLTAVDMHVLGYEIEPIRINTAVRVVSEPHGMNRYFDVTERTYHLTAPEADTVTFGDSAKKSFTSSTASSVTAVEAYAEQTKVEMMEEVQMQMDNVSALINQATHGYVVMDPNTSPERILIMDTNNIQTARKIWKWDMNGLAFSSTGINGPWSSSAITADGKISANFITVGELNGNIIKAGTIKGETIKGGTLKLGGDGNENGTLQILDGSGAVRVLGNKNGITLYSNNKNDYVQMKDYHYDVKTVKTAPKDGSVYNDKTVNATGLYIGSKATSSRDVRSAFTIGTDNTETFSTGDGAGKGTKTYLSGDNSSIYISSSAGSNQCAIDMVPTSNSRLDISTGNQSNFIRARIATSSGSLAFRVLGVASKWQEGLWYTDYGDIFSVTASAPSVLAINGGGNLEGVAKCAQFVASKAMKSPKFSTTSDRRLKEDILALNPDRAEELILALNPVEFRFIGNDKKSHGFIAQDVQELTDEGWGIVSEDEDGFLSISYEEIIPSLVATVQEQNKRINDLEERLSKLEVMCGADKQ